MRRNSGAGEQRVEICTKSRERLNEAQRLQVKGDDFRVYVHATSQFVLRFRRVCACCPEHYRHRRVCCCDSRSGFAQQNEVVAVQTTRCCEPVPLYSPGRISSTIPSIVTTLHYTGLISLDDSECPFLSPCWMT